MRVWVTREEEPGGSLCEALRAAGLTPVLEPVIERRAVSDAREEISALKDTDWLVLTSVFAINTVHEELARVPQVAVVGESSRAAAVEKGFRVKLVGANGTGDSLFAQLAEQARGTTVCYPRSSLVDPPELGDDMTVVSPVLYETVTRDFRRDVISEVDVIAVASPSAVKAIGIVDLPFASIGPATSSALRELGIDPWVEAAKPGFAELAEAIADRDRCHG